MRDLMDPTKYDTLRLLVQALNEQRRVPTAVEVATVAAPIYADQITNETFILALNRKLGRDGEPEDLMLVVVRQALALIAEAERQLKERRGDTDE